MSVSYYKFKKFIFNIIRDDDENDLISNIFDGLILILILLSVISIVAGTFSNLPTFFVNLNRYFEISSILVFSLEYFARLWTADLRYELGHIKSRTKYIFSFMAIIDLLSILPSLLPLVLKLDLRLLRLVRLIRIFRIFKLNRYTTALNSVVNVFESKEEFTYCPHCGKQLK